MVFFVTYLHSTKCDDRRAVCGDGNGISENPFGDGRYVPAFYAGMSLAVRFHEAYEYVRRPLEPCSRLIMYAAVAFCFPSHSAPCESQIPNAHLRVQRACLDPG